jgi:hypothetical protein
MTKVTVMVVVVVVTVTITVTTKPPTFRMLIGPSFAF